MNGLDEDKLGIWAIQCFGSVTALSREERNHRFLEEALELVQSLGCTVSEAHQLVDYVFNRPKGEPGQELGGTLITLGVLCYVNYLNSEIEFMKEFKRIYKKMDKIREKQLQKPKHSPLP